MSLERLEAEFATSLTCSPCTRGGEPKPASHVAVYRTECGFGVPMAQPSEPDYLVCPEHADALLTARIGHHWHCSACGQDVHRESWTHVIARVEPIRLSP